MILFHKIIATTQNSCANGTTMNKLKNLLLTLFRNDDASISGMSWIRMICIVQKIDSHWRNMWILFMFDYWTENNACKIWVHYIVMQVTIVINKFTHIFRFNLSLQFCLFNIYYIWFKLIYTWNVVCQEINSI